MSKYKLVVEDTVIVPVKFTMKVGNVNKLFSFNFEALRLSQEEINERREQKAKLVTDFMRDVMRGWDNQRLVLDEEGKPAEFNDESRDMMLSAAGVGTVLFNAYLLEVGAKEKN